MSVEPGDGPFSRPSAGPYGGARPGPRRSSLAGFWLRFLGFFIDSVVLGVAAGALGVLLGLEVDLRMQRVERLEWILGAVYFTYLHATAAAQTVGNLAAGVRVLDADSGMPVSYGRALLRYLVSFVSGVVLGLGYFWMLWDERKQTWHDKVANTVVVKSDSYPPPAPFGRPVR